MTIKGPGHRLQISVITPVFNGASTLGAAIDSVRAQTFLDWELLVIDDGSTDGSADLGSAVEPDRRIRFIRQAHSGLASARNRGIAAAIGEFVAFLDADDLWTPSYLGAMAAALRRRPDAPLAFGVWQYIDDRGGPLPQQVIPFHCDPELVAAELPWRNALVPSAVVVRSGALRRAGGFDQSFPACEDWDLWIRLRPEGRFVGVPEARALYRAHAGSLSEDLEVMERARLQLNEKHHGTIEGEPALWPFDRRRAVGHTLFTSGLAYLRRRDDDLGRQKIWRALELWPGLADDDEFYYEVACARQPRGQRGPSSGLDLDESARLIDWVLPDRGGRPIPARASLALASLGLLSGNLRLARRHARAALQDGDWRDKGKALESIAAASVPPGLLRGLRRWREERRLRARSRSAPAADRSRD